MVSQILKRWKSLSAFGVVFLFSVYAPLASAQSCGAGEDTATFNWSPAPGVGNEWLNTNNATGASQVYVVNYTDQGGSPQSLNVTVTLTDDDLRNFDTNFVCPFGAGACDDTVLNRQTQTNGPAHGPNRLAVSMASLSDTESVSFQFDFSRPGNFASNNFVLDIDDIGYGNTTTNFASYQDEVDISSSLAGTNVPLSLTGGSNVTVAGQNAKANYVFGTFGDIVIGSAQEPNGRLDVSSASPVDRVVVTYSNGPDDAAAEAAGDAPFQPPETAPHGDSDGHSISLNGFVLCITPPVIDISGNVFHDLDALTNSTVDGGGTNAGGLFASLVNGAGNVVDSVAVNLDGTYLFTDAAGDTTYTIQLNTVAQTVGVPPAAPNLPTDWVNTGENLGAGVGDDGTVDGILSVSVLAVDVTEANFGIFLTGVCEAYRVTFDDYTLATATSTIVFNSEYATGGADNTNSPLPADRGFTISAVGGENVATAYNTTPGLGGQDADLEVSDTGNGLIIQEVNPLTGTGEGGFVPDDNIGDTMTFDFEAYLGEFSATLLDFDVDAAIVFQDTATGASAFVSFAEMVDSLSQHFQPGCTIADAAVCVMSNPITAEELGITRFDRVILDMSGVPVSGVATSGGIDNIVYSIACQSIGGSVTEDTSGDGLGDTAIVGVTVQLYTDPNMDGNPADGVLVDTTVTVADGSYLFENLGLDDYVLVEIDPATYISLSDALSVDDDVAANTNTNDNIIPVTLTSVEADLNNDFVDARRGLISGVVWLDEDQDGINDIEEGGLSNIVVELRDGVCTPSVNCPTVLTDQFGNYAFDNALPGNYDIVVDPTTLPPALANTAGPFGLASRSVSLGAGEEITNQDFGYIANANTGIIGDRVWSDANGDGIQDLGEAGINNVTVELLNSLGAVIATTTTTADGDYLFTNIPFGDDYRVRVVSADPELAGFAPTMGPQSEGSFISNPVSLNAALTTVTDVDFGFDSAVTLSINDRIWYDENRDGVADLGEPGIAGVSVDLLDSNGDVVASTVTDANGDFSFTGVPDGSNYQLRVTDRDNQLDTLQESTNTLGVATISGLLSVAAGGDGIVDTIGDDGTDTFGYFNEGLIAGVVYSDPNSNSSQDPNEPGLAGIVVTLEDGLGNVVATTTTGADGSYSFDALAPGDYVVIVSQPAGTTQTEDPDASINNQTPITLGFGDSSVGNDFGYNNPALNDIFGTVFLDPDKDGVEEAGEPGIPDVTLDLIVPSETVIDGLIDLNGDGAVDAADDGTYFGFTVIDGRVDLDGGGTIDAADDGELNGVAIIDGEVDANGSGAVDAADDATLPAAVIASTIADANGDYTFGGLPDGDYQVAVTDTSGLLAGYDITSALDTLDVTIAGADVLDVDFGYVKDEATGSISGEVFIDENGDDIAQGQEFDLSGVTVWLCAAVDAPCNAVNAIATTTTDVNGEYVFSDLPPGVYEVGTDPVTVPANLTLGADPAPVSLSEGENVKDVDIGYDPDANTGILSGVVWVDANNDGNFNPGEAPLAGVTINVLDNVGTVLFTVDTGPDGKWLLTGIPIVAGVSPNDLAILYDPADIPAGLTSAQPSNLPIGDDLYFDQDLELDPDHNIGFLDFGFPPEVLTDLASIAGTVYSDADQNSDYLAATDGELDGVTLNLIDCGLGTCSDGDETVIATTITDASGNYLFDGLFPGSYAVVVTDVSNVLQGLNPLEVIPQPITLAAGDDVVGQDAGYISDPRLGSLGSRFWFDTNRDGIMQDSESGIAGITIQCWLDADQSETPNSPLLLTNPPQPGIDNLIRTVVTDESGEYYCTSLPAGQYIVRVFDSLDFTEGADGTIVTGSIADDTAKPWVYAVTSTGTPNLSADFGVSGTNSLSGTVFIEDEDLVEPNADATVDPGELDGVVGGPSPDSPAVGVPVQLFLVQTDGSFLLVQTATTDGSGNYSFVGLPDGDYRVVVKPDNTVIDAFGKTADPDIAGNAFPDNVCDSLTAADCDDATGTPIALSGGASVSGIDFGYQKDYTTTPVTVNYFIAKSIGGGVQFNWETSNEVGNLGYQIYARGSDDWVLLNEALITSGAGGAMDKRSYSYTAYNVDAKWFALVDVSAGEGLTPHGPFKLDQAYGAELEVNTEFDWQSIAPSRPTKSQVENSVNYRLNNLLDPEQRRERQ